MSRFALNIDGERVHIDNAVKMQNYFCDICNQPMIVKKGPQKAHHFAHSPLSKSKCTDSWHYDMSKWHISWQERFPEECREVVREYKGFKHRADILIDKTKTVIEFQHSELSSDEFQKRNVFYNGLGYRVVWLFDLRDHYEEDCFEFYENGGVKWHSPLKTFNGFKMEEPLVEVFFQIEYPAEENERVQAFLKLYNETGIDDAFGPDGEIYFHKHKNDKGRIVKVERTSKKGMEYFYKSKIEYTLNTWMELTKSEELNDVLNRIDTIPALWRKNKCSKAIFKDVDSGWYVKITSDPGSYNGKCYGYLSKDVCDFGANSREIYYANVPNWILIWVQQEE